MLDQEEIDRVKGFFIEPDYDKDAGADTSFAGYLGMQQAFNLWVGRNVKTHKTPGYRSVYLSLKHPASPPGDATAGQMYFIAAMAEQYSHSEIRVTHDQNLILPPRQTGRPLSPVECAERGTTGHSEHRSADGHDLLSRVGFL